MEPTNPSLPFNRIGRRPALGLAFLIVFTIFILLVGVVGGMAGFALLASSKSPSIVSLRHKLGVDDTGTVGIPVRQSIKLEESSAVIDAAKKVSPAVVSITGTTQVQNYFGQTSQQQVSGSGFIYTNDGLIITNKHVVADSDTFKVILSDGRIFDATVKARDPLDDLAVLKIDAQNLPTVELGNSDDLQIGQSVIAVGNALGEFQNSVTLGVISAKHRSLTAGDQGNSATEQLSNLLQTDAAINPGNSGGPLVNLAGQVIGINTAIASSGSGSGSIGLGFALPVNGIKTAIDSARKTGKIVRPRLGLYYEPIDKSVQQINKLSVDYGAWVKQSAPAGNASTPTSAVITGSPAEKAGILDGDILLEVNGERITTDSPLIALLQKYQVGDSITIKLQRAGVEKTVTVKLEAFGA